MENQQLWVGVHRQHLNLMHLQLLAAQVYLTSFFLKLHNYSNSLIAARPTACVNITKKVDSISNAITNKGVKRK